MIENKQNMKESAISKEGALWLIMVAATLVMGVSFFFAEKYFSFLFAIVASAVVVALAIILFAIFRKVRWLPFVIIMAISSMIGVAISAFYIKLQLSPTSFYLTIIANLFFIAVLLYIKIQTKNVKTAKRILVAFVVLEVIAAVLLGIFASKSPNILWGIFFGELNTIYMTCSILLLLSDKKDLRHIVREVAICYILGYVYIIVIAVAIAVSIACEDGSPMEACGEIMAGLVDGGNSKKKQPTNLSVK